MQSEPSNQSSRTVSLEFEDLLEQYYRPLYQFAFSLTRSEPDACDLTQHAFYTWRIKGQQLRDPSKVKAWLFTTLHRAFLQMRRWENQFRHYELEQVFSELPPVSPNEHSGLDAADVLEALEHVDDVFRAPVSLFYLQDCAYKDIAAILNVPLGTVKSRIARGISQLKTILVRNETPEGVFA